MLIRRLPLSNIDQELEPYKQAELVATTTYPHTYPVSGGRPGYAALSVHRLSIYMYVLPY